MSSPVPPRRGRHVRFLLGFAAVIAIVAAGLSYLADSDPDGLESVTRQGCTVTETEQGEQFVGRCIAQSAQDHALSESPLADYGVAGDDRFTGLAGVLGAAATLLIAGSVFWSLRDKGKSGNGG